MLVRIGEDIIQTDEELEEWLEQEWDEFLSKPNRRGTQERKTHDLVQGAPVPEGTHDVNKKSQARRLAKAIRKAREG